MAGATHLFVKNIYQVFAYEIKDFERTQYIIGSI